MRTGSPHAWPRRPSSTVGPDHGRPAPGRRGYDGWGGRHGPRTGAWTPAVGGGMPKRLLAARRRVHGRCWARQVLDACSRVLPGMWCVADARGQWRPRAHPNCGSRVTQPWWGRGVCLEPPRTRAPQIGPVESSRGWDCEGLSQGRIATERVQQGLSVGGHLSHLKFAGFILRKMKPANFKCDK